MQICFVDESGTPPKKGKVNPRPYFAIAGLFMPMAQWHSVADALIRLKQDPKFRVRGEIKWRYFAAENNDSKNTVSHLSQAVRSEFRLRLFQILKARNSIRIVACVCSVRHAYQQSYVNDEHDLYGYTYKPITERFQYHLQDISRLAGSPQCGIIVADHRGRDDDERVRRYHQMLMHADSPFVSKYDKVIEGVFLAPSHMSIGIQFADMIAGAVGRAFNSNELQWIEELKPIFRCKPNGDINGHGLIRFPSGW
jgi:hypothetical protein